MTFKELLKKRGMTQEQLAKILGRTQAAISAWVCGATTPRTCDLSKVAKALGVSVEQLLNCFER